MKNSLKMLCRQNALVGGRDPTLTPTTRPLRSIGLQRGSASPRGSIMSQPWLRGSGIEPFEANSIRTSQKSVSQVLWIGCSDSDPRESSVYRIPNDQSLELRNLGNMIIEGDLSSETMIKHAVVDLQVVRRLNSLHMSHGNDLSQLPISERDHSFVRINVLDQLRILRTFPEVSEAIALGNLHIHGVVHDPERNISHQIME
ncbi:unnamed protein product [Penicillium salamii]|nr:unnamed protein product [Penicillium salamii]CAG8166711.1 unnamed protein product [Penicillium salamii]CAG8249874.1 unnamed protein product [Penicillium salamii]